MNDEHNHPNEPHDAGGPVEPLLDGDLDALVSAVFDEPSGDRSSDGPIDDPTTRSRAEEVRHIATALRSVDPPPAEIADRNVAAALAAWDALAAGSETPAEPTTEIAPGLTGPGFAGHVPARRRRAARERRGGRWSFAPTPAWLGAAAALVLVVAAGAVMVDLGSRSPSDDSDATATLLEPAADDDARIEMFSMDDSADDMAGDGSSQDRAFEEAADADIADDMPGAQSGDTAGDTSGDMSDDMSGDMSVSEPPHPGATAPHQDARPWVGPIEVGALAEIVAALLPGPPPTADDPCPDELATIVATAESAGRPVLLGTDPAGGDAVAVDPETCRVVATSPLP